MGLKEAAPVETSRAVRAEVRSGSSLCENSNVEFARRNIVSIAFNRKRTLLPITVEWRQDRKQFCTLSARARFHTAWVKNRGIRARAARPFYPQEQISLACPGMSVWCHGTKSLRDSPLRG